MGILMDPYEELDRMRRRLKKLFGSEHEVGILTAHRGFVSPSIEIKKEKGKLVAVAKLPRMSAEDLDVQVTEDEIVIKGEQKKTRAGKEEGAVYSETRESFFYTSITLPEKIDRKTAKAEFKGGVLTITMKPKRAKELVIKETPKARKPAKKKAPKKKRAKKRTTKKKRKVKRSS